MSKHNKSDDANLKVLTHSDEDLQSWYQFMFNGLISMEGLIEDSPCLCTNAKDGRFSVDQVKVCPAYHLSAFMKFGRKALEGVPSKKINKESLVISHLCGNGPRCANPDHLILESKGINDERTHCHFCLTNAYRFGDYRGLRMLLETGLCCFHDPLCCTTNE